MSIFKHHEHDSTHESESAASKNDSETELEELDETEDPIERERDEAIRREVQSTTTFRPPGI